MVPNLPYFMVQFDHKGEKGYGHVIEGTGGAIEEGEEGMDEGEKGGGDFPRYAPVCLSHFFHVLRLCLFCEGILRVKSLGMCSESNRESGVDREESISGVTKNVSRSSRRDMISLIGQG